MIISKMTIEDIQMIHEIECECFSMPWSFDGIKTELNNDKAHFFVAKDGDKVIGYIGSYIIFDECTIANVAITKKYRNKGVASNLIDCLITQASNYDVSYILLEVRKSNKSAISLYNKFMFEEQGIRKNFYQHPVEDAIIMIRKLKGE